MHPALGGSAGLRAQALARSKQSVRFFKDGKHPIVAQRFESTARQKLTLSNLYSMPKALCDDIAAAAWALPPHMNDSEPCA